MTTPAHEASGRFTLLAAPAVVSIAMIVVGWSPTLARGGPPGVKAMMVAQAVLLAAMYISVLPLVRRLDGAGAAERLRLMFRAAGQRFVLTLLAAGLITWRGAVDRRAFLLWIGIGYVVVTLVETTLLVRRMNRTGNQACS